MVLINIPDFTPCYQSGESAPSIPQMGSGMRETTEPEQQQPPAFLQFNRDGRSADVWWEPASRKRPVLNLVVLRWTDNQEKLRFLFLTNSQRNVWYFIFAINSINASTEEFPVLRKVLNWTEGKGKDTMLMFRDAALRLCFLTSNNLIINVQKNLS